MHVIRTTIDRRMSHLCIVFCKFKLDALSVLQKRCLLLCFQILSVFGLVRKRCGTFPGRYEGVHYRQLIAQLSSARTKNDRSPHKVIYSGFNMNCCPCST